jgi:hypothetical protein
MRKLNEVRVKRNERVELYRDENIVVVVPLTHLALKKYANRCQWCINDDKFEWENYHQGRHAMVIQRNPKKLKIGITGNPTASEILIISRWGGGGYQFKDVCDILQYNFKDETELSDYEVEITNNIDNFATNIVYYSPENGIYDMEDNFLWNYHFEIFDIPNVNSKIIELMDNFLISDEKKIIQMNESPISVSTLNDSFINSYEKVVNRIFTKKYDWFVGIDIDLLTIDKVSHFNYMGIEATISVNSDWLGDQWRKHFYPIPFPDDLDDISFGDFISGDLSKNLQKNFLSIFNHMLPNDGKLSTHMSFSWIKVKPIGDEY